jgi:hypothetical protein
MTLSDFFFLQHHQPILLKLECIMLRTLRESCASNISEKAVHLNFSPFPSIPIN